MKIKFSFLQERSTRVQGGQTNEMQKIKNVLPFWIQGESEQEVLAAKMSVLERKIGVRRGVLNCKIRVIGAQHAAPLRRKNEQNV